MTDRTLDAFLAAGLLNELRGEDTWYEKITTTADALSSELFANPDRLIPYLYAALNPRTQADDVAVEATRTLLQAEWKSFASAFSGTPVLIIRAIILDAIVLASEQDTDFANASAIIISSALPNLDLGREAPAWRSTFNRIADKVECLAEERWSVPSHIKIDPLNLDAINEVDLAIDFPAADLRSLEAGFAAAAGPHNAANNPTNGNPHWPNSGDPWSKAFAPLAAKAVKKAIDDVTQVEQNQRAEAIAAPIGQAVSTYVERALALLAQATLGLELRSRLLWWKEACYSVSARRSYRDMDEGEVPGLMAFDYQSPLPAIAPASVTVFLEEAVLTLLGADSEKKVPLSERIAALRKSSHAAALQAKVKAMPFSDGRRPLLSAINDPREPATAISSLTVYSPEQDLSAREFARLVFLELQAVKAATELSARPAPKAD